VEEQKVSQEKVKKRNRIAWKVWLLSVALFLMGLLIIVPPFYANRILRPFLIEQFYQSTHHRYHLEFNKIRWSLLRNSIQIQGLSIVPSVLDSARQQKKYFVSLFKLDRLSFSGLHYLSLFDGSIHFNSVRIDSLNTQLNRRMLNDSLSENPMISSSKLLALKYLFIDHIELRKVNTQYLEDNDTVLTCLRAESDIDGFFMDVSKKVMPIFKRLTLSLKEVQWSKNGKKIKLSGFKYAIDSSRKIHTLLLGELGIQNETNGNLTRFRCGKIDIIGDSILSNLMKNRLLATKISVHLHAVENRTQGGKKQSPSEFFSQIREQWLQTKINLHIENLGVDIDTISNQTSEIQQSGHSFYFSCNSILWNKNSFKYSGMRFRMDALRQNIMSTHDSLSVQSFSYQHHRLKVLGLFSRSDSMNSRVIRIGGLSLYPLNLEQLIKERKLKVNELIVEDPQIQIYRNKTVQNPKEKERFLDDIEIAQLKISKLNLGLFPDDLYIYHADCDVDSVKWLASKKTAWFDDFKAFDLRFDSLRFASSLKEIDVLFTKSHIISDGGVFISHHFELNRQHKLRRTIEVRAQDMKLKGLNWRAILNKSHEYKFDSVSVAQLKLEAYLIRQRESKEILDSLFILKSKAIHLPDVRLDLHMIQDGDTSRLHLDKLGMISENLMINASLPQLISYSQLHFQSLQSWLSIPRDSLKVELTNWRLDMASKMLSLEGLKLHFYTQDSVKKISSYWDVRMPEAYFTGIDPLAYQLSRSIIFDTVRISNPFLKLRGERNSEIKYQGESESFYQSFRSFVNKFSKISFSYFAVNDFDVDVNSKYLGRKDLIQLKNINLGIHGFYVDYTSFEHMDHFMFSKEVNLNMLSFTQNTNQGEKIVKLRDIKVSSLDKRVFINDIRFFSLGNEKESPLIFSAQGLLLKDISIVSRPQLPELFIGNIVLQHSFVEVNKGGQKNDATFNLEKLNLFASIKHELSALKIENLELTQVDLHLNHLKQFGYQGLVLKGLSLSAENIMLDSNNRVFTDDKFLYCDNLNLELHSFTTTSLAPMYQAGFSSLSFNSRNRNIRMDSVKLTPIYDKSAFSANSEYQRDRVELLVPSLEIDKLGIRDMIFRKRFQAKKLIVHSPNIHIYKDKTLPFDTSVYKTMPAQMLRELPFYLSLDTLRIQNGRLQYEELLDMMPQAGMVYFDKLNAEVIGISNDEDFRKYGGTLKLTAVARLMSATNVYLSSVFYLNSPKQSFAMTASAESFSANILNPLIQPLTLISASDGEVSQMQMMVKGDDDVGVGSMSLRYSNLKIDVLREKNLEESQLVSFLANAILIKKNNKSLFVPRKGPIYFQRNKHRSVFNYLSHLTISGAKTSLGIEKRKTEKKIKLYAKKHK